MAIALVWALAEYRRTRSPLLLWLMLSGSLGVILSDPLGGIIGGYYIPAEAPVRLVTVLHRPMPLMDLFMVMLLGVSFYLGYWLLKRGASTRKIWVIATAIGVTEQFFEIGSANAGGFLYYNNHALIAGVPIYAMVQAITVIPVGAAATATLVPYLRGWRWIAAITFVPSVMLAYAVATTVPAYIGIHTDVKPLAGWTLALLSAALNVLVAWGAMHLDQVKKLQSAAATRDALSTAR